MFLIFDTETTGLADDYNASYQNIDNWPRVVQLSWKEYDEEGNELAVHDHIVKPEGFVIPQKSIDVHGVDNEKANKEGEDLYEVLRTFNEALSRNKYLVAHNIEFDYKTVKCELFRKSASLNEIENVYQVDTKELTVDFCQIPRKKGGGYKWPTLSELHFKLFNSYFEGAHNALADVEALANCFFELRRRNVLGFGSEQSQIEEKDIQSFGEDNTQQEKEEIPYVSIVNHTFHSVLQGAGSISDYVKKAYELGHPALGISDISTASGLFEFYKECRDKDINPILGVEMLVNDNMGKYNDKKEEGKNFSQNIFVKNYEGYKKLNKLLYRANTEGFYKIGRIKTDWLLEDCEDLIITTSSIDSYMGELTKKGKEDKAEAYLKKLLKKFNKNDVYAEIQLNEIKEQKIYNNFIIKMAKKYKLPLIITNNCFYVNENGSRLQDVLKSISQHVSIDRAKLEKRRKLHFLTRDEFHQLNREMDFNYPPKFIDHCLNNTLEFHKKCNFEFDFSNKYPKYEPTQDVIDYFGTNDTKEIIIQLSKLKLKQKLKIYEKNNIINKVDNEVVEEYLNRLNYEISVIDNKDMLDYFLVNWEIIRDYRSKGYDIGPARGCFLPGSRVKMSDGFYAPIESIQFGNKVIDAYGQERKVKNTFEYNINEEIIELELEGGRVIECTQDHEILTNNRGWVKAINLTENDDISDINNIET